MKTRYIAETLLFSVTILAFVGCSNKKSEPAPETAESVEVRTLAQAKEIFLEKVSWQDSTNTRAVAWAKLIGPNDTVEEFGSESYMHRPRAYEWFMTIDNAPGAYFKHPVNYAYLSFTDQKIQINGRSHQPKLNFETAWENISDFLEDENVVYSNSWLERPAVNSSESKQTPKFTNWPPRMATDTCTNEKRSYAVLIHNLVDLESSKETVENLQLVAQSLEASGYNVLKFRDEDGTREKLPYLNLSGSNGNGIYQLKNFVNIHRDYNDCCEEIIVYITGETGTDKSHTSVQTYFNLPFGYSGESGTRDVAKKFYAEDLALIFSDLKTCHVNIAIDSNYAEGFMEDLLSIPQVESVVAACQNDQYTYSSVIETLDSGRFSDPFGRDDGELGSEFTSSFVKGIVDHLRTDAPNNAHLLFKAGFDSVLINDLAYIGDQTLPVAGSRTMDSDCPCGVDTDKKSF